MERTVVGGAARFGMGWRAAGGEPTPPETCRTQPFETKMECYQRYLETVLQAEGAEPALTALEQITAQDPEALREAHPLVHHIGQRAFAHYGTAPLAMSHCGMSFGLAAIMGCCGLPQQPVPGGAATYPPAVPHQRDGLCLLISALQLSARPWAWTDHSVPL